MPFPPFTPAIPEFIRTRREASGQRPLIVLGDRRISYAEADLRSARLARGLLALGLAKGARVGVLMPNGPDWVVAQVARHAERGVDVGVPQHEAELARLVEGVDRDHHAADARRREPGHHPIGPVRHEDPDPGALGQSGGEEPAREPRRERVGLGVRDPSPAEHAERPRAELLAAGAEELGNGGGVGREGHVDPTATPTEALWGRLSSAPRPENVEPRPLATGRGFLGSESGWAWMGRSPPGLGAPPRAPAPGPRFRRPRLTPSSSWPTRTAVVWKKK